MEGFLESAQFLRSALAAAFLFGGRRCGSRGWVGAAVPRLAQAGRG